MEVFASEKEKMKGEGSGGGGESVLIIAPGYTLCKQFVCILLHLMHLCSSPLLFTPPACIVDTPTLPMHFVVYCMYVHKCLLCSLSHTIM